MRPVRNALELKLCKIPILGTQSENQTLPKHQEAQSSLAFGCFTGVSVIKLMLFECFYHQNKRACTNKLSHNALL
ncbi:hypothetical protein DZC36_01280 [Helicobacter pylori]|nr:hypothetical protein DZC36_01280 [Helicobacter pylori]